MNRTCYWIRLNCFNGGILLHFPKKHLISPFEGGVGYKALNPSDVESFITQFGSNIYANICINALTSNRAFLYLPIEKVC
jgi:hypothetical protein